MCAQPAGLGVGQLAAQRAVAHLQTLQFILIAVIAVAWWRPWFGALAFPLFAVIHLVTMWGRLAWQGYVFIEGPLILIGVLYLLSWRGASPANTP